MSPRSALEFPFEEDDRVLVRVREHGTTGNIIAKFEATCSRIDEKALGSPTARLRLPFGMLNIVTLRPTEAEFEVLDDE